MPLLIMPVLSNCHPNPLGKPLTISLLLLVVTEYVYENLPVLDAPNQFLFYLVIYKLDSEPCYQGESKPGTDPAVKEKLDAWLLHLPQVF
jgi:hypothetical protein